MSISTPEIFTTEFINSVRDQLLQNCKASIRIARKEFLDQYEEKDQAAVSACLDRELIGEEDSDRDFDTLKGPGGGIGIKGTGRGSTEARAVTHVSVSPEFIQQVWNACEEVLHYMPKGFTPAAIVGRLNKSDNLSQITAALGHLVAANKLEQRPGVGYRRPKLT